MNQVAIQDEQTLISNRYRGLLRASRNLLSTEDAKLLRKALNQAMDLYRGRTLPSGSPYIFRLVDVARICVESIGLGGSPLAAIMLQDTVVDKHLTIIEIQKSYGQVVAQIVDGLTKISALDPKDPKAQAENFRELILSLAKDARVILVKLAERLEHMRALAHGSREVQLKSSWEAFYLYAPLAHRLGLYRLKSEMEDIALSYTNPEDYEHIQRKLRNTSAKRNRFIKEFMAPIDKELRDRGFDFDLKGRPKSIYSIWRKMTQKRIPFEDIYDVFAIRVIMNSQPKNEKSDCWQVYSIITDKWTPNPERMRDWVSVPKTNGYESLHTTVIGPEGKWVEVQIRTKRMDEIAEKGLAAHWKYKGMPQEAGIDGWLMQIREMIEMADPSSPEDIVDQLQLNLYSDEVFVFTPNGDIKKLPLGATVLDFAFSIHSSIGRQCVGGKINNRNVPIKHLLNNGDMVTIITSKNQKPRNEWLNMVVTSRAKAKIKQMLREERSKEINIAKEAFYRRLKNWKVSDPEEVVRMLQKRFKCRTAVDLFEMISSEKVSLAEIKEVLDQEQEEHISAARPAQLQPKDPPEERVSSGMPDYLIIDDKLLNIDYRLSSCCKPIYGDEIFGFITISSGIKIHRVTCPNAVQMHGRYPYRIIGARWKANATTTSFQTTIRVTGFDEFGIANRITELITKDMKVNIRSFSISSANGMFEGVMQVHVSDTKHLEMLIYRLTKIKGVQKAVRQRGD